MVALPSFLAFFSPLLLWFASLLCPNASLSSSAILCVCIIASFSSCIACCIYSLTASSDIFSTNVILYFFPYTSSIIFERIWSKPFASSTIFPFIAIRTVILLFSILMVLFFKKALLKGCLCAI